MTKIYTKTGDKGMTFMLGGKRVSKSCLEMEAIGEVDETNAFLSLLITGLADTKDVIPAKAGIQKNKKMDSCLHRNDIVEKLVQIQNDLFTIGANLAALQSTGIETKKLRKLETKKLEKWIDRMEKDLPKLKNFILPGGSKNAAVAYIARAVCRRAERAVIKLSENYQVEAEIKKYLNRLSDLLFVLSRWINKEQKIEERVWKGKKMKEIKKI